MAYRNSGPRVVQHVLIVCRLEQSVDRHRNCTDLDGAEETDGEFGAVVQEQEDAFFDAHAEMAQPVSEAVYAFPELAITDANAFGLDGNFFSTAFV